MNKGERWKELLGTRVRNIRILNGWTQRDLAARLRRGGFRRCSRALLSQIETGVATIRGHEIYYLRQVFGDAFEIEFWKPFYERRARGPIAAKDPLEK